MRYALEQRGIPIEIVRAATASADIRPLRARRVADALQAMRSSEDFQALAVLFKRVKNIARELKEDSALDRERVDRTGRARAARAARRAASRG